MHQNSKQNLKPLARKLRTIGTRGEALLWRDVLRGRQFWPYQFNRQYPIGNYIVDFISRRLYLIIEIDGSSHFVKSEEDFDRQQFLENLGYTILRFSEAQVVFRMDDVIAEIDYAVGCIEENLGNNL
jgi:very-short-patch-repair endonuclease